MKQLNLADSRLDAPGVRELLATERIEVSFDDDESATNTLWVSEKDLAAAEDIIRKSSSLPANEPERKLERDQTSSTNSARWLPNDDDDEEDDKTATPEEPEPVDTTSIRRAWIGLIAVAIVFLPLYSPLTLLFSAVANWLRIRTFYEEVVFDIFKQGVRAACVLLIVLWDGAPLGVFGLKKPMWSVDTITSCIVFAAHWTLGLMAVDLFADFLHSVNYGIQKSQPIFHVRDFEHSWISALLLLLLSVSIGFTEELAIRGYFIPRLERVVKSKVWAVLISAAFFGCMHLRRGIVAVWATFWFGVIYGIAFIWTHRLWPTVFAHAGYDFAVYLLRA